MLVLATLERPRPPARWRRRAPEPPVTDGEPVLWLTRATVIDVAEPLAPAAAAAWLRDAGEAELAAGVVVLNRALAAQRIAAADSQLETLDRRHALATRVGYGAGEQVADGQFSDVRELVWQPPRRGRRRMLAPDARVAALLGGREAPLVVEELALRARADLGAGRPRHAALQLMVALDAGLAELDVESERLEELRGHRGPVAEAAQAALGGEPSAEQVAAVAAALARLEAALRARTAGRG